MFTHYRDVIIFYIKGKLQDVDSNGHRSARLISFTQALTLTVPLNNLLTSANNKSKAFYEERIESLFILVALCSLILIGLFFAIKGSPISNSEFLVLYAFSAFGIVLDGFISKQQYDYGQDTKKYVQDIVSLGLYGIGLLTQIFDVYKKALMSAGEPLLPTPVTTSIRSTNTSINNNNT